MAKKIEIRRAAGKLRFYAGRLENLIEKPDGVEASFRERGTTRKHILQVAKVINCTGPRSDYSKYQHPLLVNLLARGLIDHDPLALGLNALPDGEMLEFGRLKAILGATDGNMGTHLTALEKAGYIGVTKDFVGKKPRTRATISSLNSE